MSVYVTQFFKKTSKISKDKELINLLSKLNSEKEDKILAEALAVGIQKQSMLFKHPSSLLLKKMFGSSTDEETVSFIKNETKKYLNSEISRVEFVDNVFSFLKKRDEYIPKTYFLLYVKKIQEKKIIEKIKNSENIFELLADLKEKKEDRAVSSIVEKISSEIKNYSLLEEIEEKINEKNILPESETKRLIKNLATRFFYYSKNSLFNKRLGTIVYKILTSEPISYRDIENILPRFVAKEMGEETKKDIVATVKQILVPKIKDMVKKEIKKNPELEFYIDASMYSDVFSNVFHNINLQSPNKEEIEDFIISTVDENSNVFFNFNRKTLEKLINQTLRIRENVKSEETVKTLDSFLEKLKETENGSPDKDALLEIKELYEEIKEKIFLYENNPETIQNFSLLREAFKETFFKSTDTFLEIYRNSGITDITVKTEAGDIVFNPHSRTFELLDNNKNPVASLPVKAVMNKERTGFKKEINLSYSFGKNKKAKVLNFEEINKILQTNFYKKMCERREQLEQNKPDINISKEPFEKIDKRR